MGLYGVYVFIVKFTFGKLLFGVCDCVNLKMCLIVARGCEKIYSIVAQTPEKMRNSRSEFCV